MTKNRTGMSSLELGVTDDGDKHRGGDCRCGNRHISERAYAGFSFCLICQKLSPSKKRVRKATDAFARLRRRSSRHTVGPVDRAVAYLGAWLGPEGKAWVRETYERKGSWDAWLVSFHNNFGTEVRNALRKVGYPGYVFGARTLDDVYVSFLATACDLELPE